MSVTPTSKSLKNLVQSTFSSKLKCPAVIDNSVINGNFTFKNCKDIHIGPKYENNSSVVINNISVPNLGEVPQEIQSSVNKDAYNYWTEGLYDKYFIKPSSQVITKATLVLALLIIIIMSSFIIYFKSNERSKEQTKYTATTIEGPDWKNRKGLFLSHWTCFLVILTACIFFITFSPGFACYITDNYPTDLHFVMRETWGAAQSYEDLNNNTLPLTRVIFIHTAGAGTCNKFYACKQQMQSIQEMHITQNYGDIGYNFVIGSDGYIYIGVGWDKVGAHTRNYNYGSLGVAFIGDFRKDEPNQLMLTAATNLLEFGVKIKKLDSAYQLFGHCQIHSSFPVSPGKNIMNQIKKWSHWNDTNFNWCVG